MKYSACWSCRLLLCLRPHAPTFSVISCEWCNECSLSRNILCCSELARRQVNHVDKVQDEIPGEEKSKEGCCYMICWGYLKAGLSFRPRGPCVFDLAFSVLSFLFLTHFWVYAPRSHKWKWVCLLTQQSYNMNIFWTLCHRHIPETFICFQSCHTHKSKLISLPRQARVIAARWIECIESGRLFRARTNWKLRIPPIRPQMQHAENRIIWRAETEREIMQPAELITYQQNCKQTYKMRWDGRWKPLLGFHLHYSAGLDAGVCVWFTS